MPRLTGARPERRDRGAIAVLVAVMITSGMVSGFGALTVDVGLIYAERAQLQTAADASAIAVAKLCALHRPECNQRDAYEQGIWFARNNVKKAAVEISEICGLVRVTDPVPGRWPIAPCARTADNLTGCLGDTPESGEYIEVRVRTNRSGDSTALPPVFAGAVTGTDGVTVGACARATWQQISTVTEALSIVVSDCVFDHARTEHGPQPSPVDGEHRVETDDAEVVLPFREVDDPSPRGFGYCRDPEWDRVPGQRASDATDGFSGPVLGGCVQRFTIGTVRELEGGGGDEEAFWDGCFPTLMSLVKSKDPVSVAVYRPDAATGRPYIDSVRNMVITGWHHRAWPDSPPARPDPEARWNVRSTLTGNDFCDPSANSCISGYFTSDPAGGGAAGPSSIRISG